MLLAAETELVKELRGSTFHPPTLDFLDEFAIVPRMIEVGLKAPTWQFRDRETGPVATFDLSLLARDTNHPYRVQCEQWKLMRFLEEELRKLPGADIRFGHEVTAVRQSDDAVTVTARVQSGSGVHHGPIYRSPPTAPTARCAQSLGIEFEGFTYPELFLIASTDFPFENTLTDIAYVNYIADPHEWLVLLRVPGLWRVLVPAPENSDRAQAPVGRIAASGVATRGRRAPSPTGSPIAPSITCIKRWRKAFGMAASCWPAMPRTSITRSAAWG